MLHIPSVRQSTPLLIAVFAVGAGVGALVVALSNHASAKRIVVKHMVAAAPVSAARTTPRTRSPRARSSEARIDSGYGSTVPSSAAESFAALEPQLGGLVGLAVAPLGAGSIHTFGQVQVAHAWSTSKVPVLVTLLNRYEKINQTLSPRGQTYAALALEQSDNAAIEALFGELERLDGGLLPASTAVQQMLRNAGDRSTMINTAPNDQGFTTYGQSEWAVRGEVAFYRALARGCLIDPHDTSYVLGLLRSVIPSQRWGAGAAGYPSSVAVAFKGGWGPDSSGNYQVRQTAIIGSGNRGYVVSMLALPSGGSFAEGANMISALARWARQHFILDANSPPTYCSGSQ